MYCTTYDITIENISDFSENDDVLESLRGRYKNAVWRNHDVDMILLSSKFPGKLFTLRTQGENRRDKNEIVYCDGVKISEKCDILV